MGGQLGGARLLGEEVGGERGEEGERVVERGRRAVGAGLCGRLEFGRFELAERGEQVVAGGELGLDGASARRDFGWRRQVAEMKG